MKSAESRLISSKSMGKSIIPTLNQPHSPILLEEISRLLADFADHPTYYAEAAHFPSPH